MTADAATADAATADAPAAAGTLAAFGRALLDLCVPGACPLCGADGPVDPPRLTVRCGCRDRFASKLNGWCRGCGAPTGPLTPDADDCAHCRREAAFPFSGAVSLGLHDGPLREAVLRAKTDGGRPAARALAEDLLERRPRPAD